MPPYRRLLFLAGSFLLVSLACSALSVRSDARTPSAGQGEWPTQRQNRQLTAIQPLPGRIRSAPHVVAHVAFTRGKAALSPFASRPGGTPDRAVALADGWLRCYDLGGTLLWEIH